MRTFTSKLALYWALVIVTLFAVPAKPAAAGLPPVLPLPGLDVNVRKMKVQNSGAPIVELYRPLEAEPRIDLAAWMPELAHERESKDKQGKVDVAKLGNRLKDGDFDDVRRYVTWILGQQHAGTNFEVTDRFLNFPQGPALLIRPALQRYDGIALLLGSLDGGRTWNPGIMVPGKGWAIPFSSRQVQAGGKEFMALFVDHSNRKQIEVSVFSFGTKNGRGNQYVPYQFNVSKPVDEDGNRLDVEGMTLKQFVSCCQGIVPPWTNVAPGSVPVTTVVKGTPARDHDRKVARDTDKDVDAKADVTVEAVDRETGQLLTRDVRATVWSLDRDGNELDSQEVTVNGPTVVRVKKGASYGAETLKGEGEFEVLSQKAERGGARFVFEEVEAKRPARRNETELKRKPKHDDRDDNNEVDRRDGGEAAQVVYTVYMSKADQAAAYRDNVPLRFAWFVNGKEVPATFGKGMERVSTPFPASAEVRVAYRTVFLRDNPAYKSLWRGKWDASHRTYTLVYDPH